MVQNSFAKVITKAKVTVNKMDGSVKLPFSPSPTRECILASGMETVGTTCLVVSPRIHFPSHGLLQSLRGLACVPLFF